VTFGVHHLMIRPRDGHDMRLLDSSLVVEPKADVRWAYDTFGNSVAWLTFHDAADELIIESVLELRRYGFDEPLPRIERHAVGYPFSYDADDSIDLAPLLVLLYPADRPAVEAWVAGVVAIPPAGSLQLLDRLCSAIHGTFDYRRRVAAGVQSPAETIARASGTCRDFALLFMEAARLLGFAARFVTGYLYDQQTDPGQRAADDPEVSGGGSTHAWADVFIPGAGWIEFDPTNRIVAGRNLIRVATTRSPAQSVPASGTYRHEGATFLGIDVRVSVCRID
jgi:transglutaminase-like putative cysteine protease